MSPTDRPSPAPPTAAPRRALVVIDVQNEYFDGELPIRWPPPGVSLQRIAEAMDTAARHDVPVIVVRQRAALGSQVFAPGTRGAELHREVAARPATIVIDKTWPSAFTGTELDARLRELGADTLTIVGYMTQNCVAATAFDAFHRGYRVEVLIDATGAPGLANGAGTATAEEIHRVFTVVFQSRAAAVLTTRAWGRRVAALEPASIDTIPASVRRARTEYVADA